MRDSDLVVAVNGIDDLAMVKNVEAEESLLILKVFTVFSQANVEGS